MAWVELLSVFLACHLAGDFLLQTERQANHKRGGLGADPVARRALALHSATYTLAFLPALVWIAVDRGTASAVGAAALIALPHLVQDDGRLVVAYGRAVKGLAGPPSLVLAAVDQSFHVLALFAVALLIGS